MRGGGREDRLDLGGQLDRRLARREDRREPLVAERGGVVDEPREALADVAQRRLEVVRDRGGEHLEIAAGAFELERAISLGNGA